MLLVINLAIQNIIEDVCHVATGILCLNVWPCFDERPRRLRLGAWQLLLKRSDADQNAAKHTNYYLSSSFAIEILIV